MNYVSTSFNYSHDLVLHGINRPPALQILCDYLKSEDKSEKCSSISFVINAQHPESCRCCPTAPRKSCQFTLTMNHVSHSLCLTVSNASIPATSYVKHLLNLKDGGPE